MLSASLSEPVVKYNYVLMQLIGLNLMASELELLVFHAGNSLLSKMLSTRNTFFLPIPKRE